MENNPVRDSEELTSTNDNYSETDEKDTKNENNDSIPTSSTDASITSSSVSTTQLIAPDDPISSTSSDIIVIDTNNTAESELECSSSKSNELVETMSTNSLPQTSSFVSEKDLLDMNISDVSTEKITENVDDLVQDLENLLGEPTTSLDFPIRINETKACRSKDDSNDCTVDNSDNVQESPNICSVSEEIVYNNNYNTSTNEEITSNIEKIATPDHTNPNQDEVVNDDLNAISSNVNSENPSNLELVDSSTSNNEVKESEPVTDSQTTTEKADDSMEIDETLVQKDENIARTSQQTLQDSNAKQIDIVEESINDNTSETTSNEVSSETVENEAITAANTESIEGEEEKSEVIVENIDNTPQDEEEEEEEKESKEDLDNNENNLPESTVEDVENTAEQIQEVTDSNQVVDMEIEEPTSTPITAKHDDNVVDSTNFSETQIEEEKPVNSCEITESSTTTNVNIVDDLKDNGKSEDNVDSLPSTSSNMKLDEPLLINVDDYDKERQYNSPKMTIKPIKDEQNDEKDNCKGSLKMTITKQSDNMHSILKIYNPNDNNEIIDNQELTTIPKLIIKPVLQQCELEHSPKLTTKTTKICSPSHSNTTVQRSASPRITIKPIIKPENLTESVSPLKITIVKNDQQKHSPKLTIKPIVKPDEIVEETTTKTHSPRITIKPIVKPDEDVVEQQKTHSPRVTIKPIVKPDETIEQQQQQQVESESKIHSPKITIKPIIKPNDEEIVQLPRITIKPLVKPQEEIVEKSLPSSSSIGSPKITIKPIMKPPPTQEEKQHDEIENEVEEEEIKERIVLKINKGSLPSSSSSSASSSSSSSASSTSSTTSLSPSNSSNKDDEKLTKITLKFSKEGGHPHIVQTVSQKRSAVDDTTTTMNQQDQKKFKPNDYENLQLPIITHSKLKEILNQSKQQNTKPVTIDLDDEDEDDDIKIVEENTTIQSPQSPIVISEESNQEISNKPEIIKQEVQQQEQLPPPPPQQQQQTQEIAPIVQPDIPPIITPRKRGRPRKVPLQVREDFKDIKEEEIKPIVIESTRPKRSCRGPSVKTTLGIKPRKPRGPGRGRGSKRGMGNRSLPATSIKEIKSKLMRDDQITTELDDGGFLKTTLTSGNLPQTISTSDRADIVMYEEETRMSADTSINRSKQVATPISIMDIEESQSSVQSTATIESVKARRGTRLEVHQEPEGAVISADQLAEYYWSGSGPYMLQEQVAQFLGIKSFKRKYPTIPRRVVDMQERDFIRESGLACEAMCDLGLTAVNTADILDIMYSDFQDKYEEYCKHQRDRQAKDLTNKQRALTLAASQEKTKLDITQQAVQSAANWNLNFNKMRRTQRKACMDLQTLTVHYPRGKMRPANRTKLGYYPVALVPGQFTDYYKEFSPGELIRLPINTIQQVNRFNEMECDSQTDGSGSESDSSSSDTDSSYSGSSDGENCTLCKPQSRRIAAV